MIVIQKSITELPVSVAEAKQRLRIEHAEDDSYIEALIQAASVSAGNRINQSVVKATYEQRLYCFPKVSPIQLRSPVVAITSVAYKDEDGAAQTLTGADYELGAHKLPNTLTPTVAWPAGNGVVLTYDAGMGVDAEPPIKQWILLHVGLWYRNREAATVGQLSELPHLHSLLSPYKLWEI